MLHTLRAEYSKIFASDCLFFSSYLPTLSAQSGSCALTSEYQGWDESLQGTRSQSHSLTLENLLVLHLQKLQMGSCNVEPDTLCAQSSPHTSVQMQIPQLHFQASLPALPGPSFTLFITETWFTFPFFCRGGMAVAENKWLLFQRAVGLEWMKAEIAPYSTELIFHWF